MRINKYLADSGYCSRRQADVLVEQKKVYINGKRAVLGDVVKIGDSVKVDHKLIIPKAVKSYLIYYKPEGVICTTDLKSPNNIIDAISYPERIFPVGRLDVNSSGLIFLTNDGDWANRLMHPKYEHAKEYLVEVDLPVSQKLLDGLKKGVNLTEGIARADNLKTIDNNHFKITIHQGWNRQIRRMVEHFGYEVVSLTRIRIGNVGLDTLKVGKWRVLTKKEVESF
ncbi:MAG: pseudouridine synthase [Patescibacteria group bacterium]|jgi:23S rRNA pseudouridine2604 synthase